MIKASLCYQDAHMVLLLCWLTMPGSLCGTEKSVFNDNSNSNLVDNKTELYGNDYDGEEELASHVESGYDESETEGKERKVEKI